MISAYPHKRVHCHKILAPHGCQSVAIWHHTRSQFHHPSSASSFFKITTRGKTPFIQGSVNSPPGAAKPVPNYGNRNLSFQSRERKPPPSPISFCGQASGWPVPKQRYCFRQPVSFSMASQCAFQRVPGLFFPSSPTQVTFPDPHHERHLPKFFTRTGNIQKSSTA